jgi:hypothetical protein
MARPERPKRSHGVFEHGPARVVERAVLEQRLAGQRRIQRAPRFQHARQHLGGALAAFRATQQDFARLHRYLHMQVEAVEQRTGQFRLIAGDLGRGALAGNGWVSLIAR